MKRTLAGKIGRRIRLTASSAALYGLEKNTYYFGLRDPGQLTLPDFLGIGAQKAATAWVWQNLRCHPEIFLPRKKELHYFDLNFYRSLRVYADHFKDAGGRVKGEITPAYSILPPSKIRYLKKTNPNIKVFIILRNPIDRAWSRAKMVLSAKYSNGTDLNRIPDRVVFKALSHRSSRLRGDYVRILDNWSRFFTNEQMLICFYDDIRTQPKKFLIDLFDFIGVSTEADWHAFPVEEVIHGGAKKPVPEQFRGFLNDAYGPEIDRLKERFGSHVESWKVALSTATEN